MFFETQCILKVACCHQTEPTECDLMHTTVLPRTDAHHRLKASIVALGVLALVSLVVTMAMPPLTSLTQGHTDMLSVHILMELFAIIIAMLVVSVSWHTFDAREARSANILVCGFLIVACCDLVHALSYAGMPDFLAPSGTPRAIFSG